MKKELIGVVGGFRKEIPVYAEFGTDLNGELRTWIYIRERSQFSLLGKANADTIMRMAISHLNNCTVSCIPDQYDTHGEFWKEK